MARIEAFRGAIFDLDDTLLDNNPSNDPTQGLHAQSRLKALHVVARKYDIPELEAVTPEDNLTAFLTAKTHSAESAVWNTFYLTGLAPNQEISLESGLYPLMEEIIEEKNRLHAAILCSQGREVPGASNFVKRLALAGLEHSIAMATASIERDAVIFLRKYQLQQYFPPARTITSKNITHPKPDPESFDLAFGTLHLPDSSRPQIIAFEDDPRGIIAAKKAGLYVCAITTRFNRNDPALLAVEPDLIADSYEEFAAVLELEPITRD